MDESSDKTARILKQPINISAHMSCKLRHIVFTDSSSRLYLPSYRSSSFNLSWPPSDDPWAATARAPRAAEADGIENGQKEMERHLSPAISARQRLEHRG
jgi:hypothetical protein